MSYHPMFDDLDPGEKGVYTFVPDDEIDAEIDALLDELRRQKTCGGCKTVVLKDSPPKRSLIDVHTPEMCRYIRSQREIYVLQDIVTFLRIPHQPGVTWWHGLAHATYSGHSAAGPDETTRQAFL